MKGFLICALLFLAAGACHQKTDPPPSRVFMPGLGGMLHGQDWLFLDLKFGMTREEFMGYCKRMNARGIFTNGFGSRSVLYRSDSTFRSTVTWRFFPEFHNDRIFALHAIMSYDAYAPWNHTLNANSLLKDIIEVFCRWYGPGGLKAEGGKDLLGQLVKVDGYRKIIIRKTGERDVKIDYVDLRVKENPTIDGQSF